MSQNSIQHFDIHTKSEKITANFLTDKRPLKILMTSGASCPDALVEGIINKLQSFFGVTIPAEEVLQTLN